jgi:hypothetical protein
MCSREAGALSFTAHQKMANKQSTSPTSTIPPSFVPTPRSRREELLTALLKHATDPVHIRLLEAYRATGTVEGAEREFTKIIKEIIDET